MLDALVLLRVVEFTHLLVLRRIMHTFMINSLMVIVFMVIASVVTVVVFRR